MSSAKMRHPRNRSTRSSSRQVLSSDSKALVISGGAAHGAFAVGAAYVLIKEKAIDFDLFVGTSTGGLVSSLAIIGEIDELERIYTTVKTEDIIKENSFFSLLASTDGFYNSTPLRELIAKELTRERFDKIMASPKTLVLTTVNLKTGRLEHWSTKKIGSKILGDKVNVFKPDEHEVFKNVLWATSSIPVFMNSVQIRRNGARYVDGGLREIAGVEIALALGSSEVITIVMSPEDADLEDHDNNRFNLLEVALRTFDISAREISRNDVAIGTLFKQMNEYTTQLKMLYAGTREEARQKLDKAVFDELFPQNALERIQNPFDRMGALTSFHVIRPTKDDLLEGGGLDFVPKIMASNLEKGKARVHALRID